MSESNGNDATPAPAVPATLKSLLDIADLEPAELAKRGPPWEAGHVLQIMGHGGVYGRDRRQVSISPKSYRAHVAGNRTAEIARDYELRCDQNVVFEIGGQSSSGEEGTREDAAGSGEGEGTGVATGEDRLVVNGDMSWEFDQKMTQMSGTINRVWMGGVTRFVGMEGIICGGALVRMHVGPAMTVSQLSSGDVYGGCARCSLARVQIAGIGYRSMDVGVWFTGAYSRFTTLTLEPAVGSMSPDAVRMSTARKAAKITMSLLPFVEIGYGVASFLLAPVLALLAKAVGHKQKPPNMAPRLRTRVVAMAQQTSATVVNS